MELVPNLKHAICTLFEVHEDSPEVQRIVTPIEYPGSNDKVVIRVRQRGAVFEIDENGEAAFYASMHGGEVESESINRWAAELNQTTGIEFSDETICATLSAPHLIAPTIFSVAAAAQQLFALATSQKERAASDFKEQVKSVLSEVAAALSLPIRHQVDLPIAGHMVADHVIDHPTTPMIIIAAPSSTRLLEAELIYMQYRYSKQPGFVLAIAESEQAVGKKQFTRANFYTSKTVPFSASDVAQMVRQQLH